MSFEPTEEQKAIVSAACTTTESLLINALAGAAKTTTLELICKALPPTSPILSLAFNKRIAEEMTKRLPGHVKCQTLNSLGHGVWMRACSKRIVLDKDKTYTLLKEKVDALRKSEKTEAYETFNETKKLIGQAKLSGYIPDGTFPTAHRLLTSAQFFGEGENRQVQSSVSWTDEEGISETQKTLINQVLIDSIRQSYDGRIDFDDQIYMPTLFGGTFPQFPLVLVDEAQDLSAINHTMLKKLVTKRLIAVGDPFQSIYGFRGAVASGMSYLQGTFGMREMTLSTSFRCPIEVVLRARSRAPSMQWPAWAKQGAVHEPEEWSALSIPDGAAIICRNNAPLFSMAFRLLRAGRGVQLVGSDIGPALVKTLRKLGPEHLSTDETIAAINIWEKETLLKTRSKAATHDKAECLRVFASFGSSLGAAIAYAETIFAAKGPIQLLSGHKAKGLEWENVFHLDPWRIPSVYSESDEELEQERNVRYVIETRAKENLFLVNLETFNG